MALNPWGESVNPTISIVGCMLISAAIGLVGARIGYLMGYRDEKRTSDDLAGRLGTSRLQYEDAVVARDLWKQASERWRVKYVEALTKRTPDELREAQRVEDPPTVGEADRRAVAARRERGQPVGVRDRELAPVPQLRDADDDH